jgi:hypothetical protein
MAGEPNQILPSERRGVELQSLINKYFIITKIGQVSLPVLSRKGKYDD